MTSALVGSSGALAARRVSQTLPGANRASGRGAAGGSAGGGGVGVGRGVGVGVGRGLTPGPEGFGPGDPPGEVGRFAGEEPPAAGGGVVTTVEPRRTKRVGSRRSRTVRVIRRRPQAMVSRSDAAFTPTTTRRSGALTRTRRPSGPSIRTIPLARDPTRIPFFGRCASATQAGRDAENRRVIADRCAGTAVDAKGASPSADAGHAGRAADALAATTPNALTPTTIAKICRITRTGARYMERPRSGQRFGSGPSDPRQTGWARRISNQIALCMGRCPAPTYARGLTVGEIRRPRVRAVCRTRPTGTNCRPRLTQDVKSGVWHQT
jgi:hypothetical protein